MFLEATATSTNMYKYAVILSAVYDLFMLLMRARTSSILLQPYSGCKERDNRGISYGSLMAAIKALHHLSIGAPTASTASGCLTAVAVTHAQ